MNQNPRILALDTSLQSCSVALQIDDTIIERAEFAPRGQGELLLPMIESVLSEAGVALQALDAVAFARGPGSFTGMRIGVGVVQGLAFSADLPVVPVSTLQMLAQGAARELDARQVLVAVDAHMEEIYWGAYWCGEDGLMTAAVEDGLCSPMNIPSLPPSEQKWLGVGDAWSTYNKLLHQQVGDHLLTARSDRQPAARELLPLAMPRVLQGDTVSAEVALPVYLRDKTAWKK